MAQGMNRAFQQVVLPHPIKQIISISAMKPVHIFIVFKKSTNNEL